MKIRKATKEDCPGMLQLIRELAEYEKAPEEVTVDPIHFEESGFGANPVWWAFVVEEVEEAEGLNLPAECWEVEGLNLPAKGWEVEGLNLPAEGWEVEGLNLPAEGRAVEEVEEGGGNEVGLSEDLQISSNLKTSQTNPLLPRQMGRRHSSSGIGGVDHTSEASMRRGGSTPSTHIIAFALYYIRYSTWKGQVMYLEDILVTESMRGKGIGKLLIERLKEEAREKGFKRITWQVLDWNEPAINFYKKFDTKFDPAWVNVLLDL